jgi:hypothetical protein
MNENNLTTEKPEKEEKPKTSLQDGKKQKISEMKADADPGEQKKKPKGRPKGSKTKKKKKAPAFEPPTPEQTAQEAQMFLDTMDALRSAAGIQKKIQPNHREMFAQSYHQISLKYGSSMARYMPELMFGLSSGFILFDTFVELRKIRALQIEEKKRKTSAEKKEEKAGVPKNQEFTGHPEPVTSDYVPPEKGLDTERGFAIDA